MAVHPCRRAGRCERRPRKRRDATLKSADVILHGRAIEQTIDRSERASFFKELIVTGGAVPLAMVRSARSRETEQLHPCCSCTASGRIGTRGTRLRAAWPTRWPSPATTCSTSTFAATVVRAILGDVARARSTRLRPRRSAQRRRRSEPPQRRSPRVVDRAFPRWPRQLRRRAFARGRRRGHRVDRQPVLVRARVASALRHRRPLQRHGAHALLLANAPVPVAGIGAPCAAFCRFAETPSIRPRGWHAGAVEPHVLDEICASPSTARV